ncbi:SDR family oxidoreductase [Chloroflexota bacterium]
MQRIAVVTGASRGLGFEICRQLAHLGMKVVLTARDEAKGREAAQKLQNESLDVEFYPLDVTKEESIHRLAEWVEQNFTRVDILINNAGIIVDRHYTALQPDIDKIKETMETNVYGPLRLCKALVPIMVKNNFGRIVNVSSNAGALSKITTGRPGYRISKTALNVVTKLLANELLGTNITINSMHPGGIHTDMNPHGERPVEEGADTAVWLATECAATGKFFYDRKETDW